MDHFRRMGTIIYLKLPYDQLKRRLGNLKGRGVVLKKGQTLRDIYEERTALYEQWADAVIEEEGRDIEATLKEILNFCLQIQVDGLI